MPRSKAVKYPDDADVDLAPPVTAAQRAELARLRYRGPTPSTQPQAAALLKHLEAEQHRRGGPRSA
jgi:hypothetical protein